MIEVEKLKTRSVKDLAAMAKRKGVPGWHSMRKDELIKALVKQAKLEAHRLGTPGKNGKNGKAAKGAVGNHSGQVASAAHRAAHVSKGKSAQSLKRLKEVQEKLALLKDLGRHAGPDGWDRGKDRLVVMVRDPYWLHAHWDLSRQSIDRVRVALGQRWHCSRPVLRLVEVAQDGTTSTVRNLVRDIEIHGGVNDWYVDVYDPPKSYQMDIGYLAPDGKFLSVARSNVVTTPRCSSAASADGNWEEVAEDFDRIYALSGGYSGQGDNSELKGLFEERLRRPMGAPMVTRFGLGAGAIGHERRDFCFEVDAELVVFGVTEPGTHVTLKGEPVKLQADGSFSVRLNLPDRRQVLPVVASSADGMEQRTIVLAVERNTKVMEPITREPDA